MTDSMHRKIMQAKDAFVNEDDFDQKEALEAVIDKRKFLLERVLKQRCNRDIGEGTDSEQ